MDNLNLEQVLMLLKDKRLPRGVVGNKSLIIRNNSGWFYRGTKIKNFRRTLGVPLGEQKDAENIFNILKKQGHETT